MSAKECLQHPYLQSHTAAPEVSQMPSQLLTPGVLNNNLPFFSQSNNINNSNISNNGNTMNFINNSIYNNKNLLLIRKNNIISNNNMIQNNGNIFSPNLCINKNANNNHVNNNINTSSSPKLWKAIPVICKRRW